MAKGHILIVEDEEKIAMILMDYLDRSGYRVSCLDRGDTVPAFVKHNDPDLILLDIMLPGMNGMDVCKSLRMFSQTPIIMVTAKVEEIDRLLGLELGADDYICKPFSPREVVARVKAVLRRSNPVPSGQAIRAGGIIVNEETHEVTVLGHRLNLTPIEYGLLRVLMTHPGRVFSRSELVSRVQGYDYEGYDRTVDTHIKNIRKKISAYLPDVELIYSVYGIGYRLEVP